VGGSGGGSGSGLRRRRVASSFPLKNEAGYIGYLTDSESSSDYDDVFGGGGGAVTSVRRRRSDLLGSDVSFSSCLMLFITVGGLLLLFLFALSPWGVPPPRRL
jgi:hypothetical protein